MIAAHEKVGRTVFGIVIGRWITVLSGGLVILIEAEIDVEKSVAIVVGCGGAGERTLRRIRELECIRLLAELAASVVDVKHRAAGANNDDILVAFVAEI